MRITSILSFVAFVLGAVPCSKGLADIRVQQINSQGIINQIDDYPSGSSITLQIPPGITTVRVNGTSVNQDIGFLTILDSASDPNNLVTLEVGGVVPPRNWGGIVFSENHQGSRVHYG